MTFDGAPDILYFMEEAVSDGRKWEADTLTSEMPYGCGDQGNENGQIIMISDEEDCFGDATEDFGSGIYK